METGIHQTAAVYDYTGINPNASDIRLVTLLPGSGDDMIRVSFSHTMVPIPTGEPDPKPSLAPLQATLPEGWRVTDTVDGNLLFIHDKERRTSWTHPVPSVTYVESDWRPVPPEPAKHPAFEALSYCWGTPFPEEPILVVPGEAPVQLRTAVDDGPDTGYTRRESTASWRTLPVRPNLAAALRHLRRENEPRTMWIDAICIDQLNLEERGRHVARMGSIYLAASRAVVWLGEASADSAEALDALELLGRQMELLDSQSVPAPGATHPGWLTNYPVEAGTIAAIKNMLARHWFGRLWIWQEIVLGHRDALVQCGDKLVSWYHLRRGLVILRETHLPDARMRDGLMANPLLFLPYCTIPYAAAWDGIAGLIHGTSRAGCCDARDRRIQPNYYLSTEEVLVGFFMEFFAEYNSLLLMRFCDLETHRLDGPSWVPDLCNLVLRPTQQTFAAGNSVARASFPKEGVMAALGVQAAVVEEVSDFEMNGTPADMTKTWRYLKNWYEIAEANVSAESLGLAFFSTIYYGWVRDRLMNGEKLPTALYHEEMKAFMKKGGRPSAEQLAASDLINMFVKNDRHNCFFSTDKGHVGMGPVGVRAGDVVSVLLGNCLCILLRPQGDGTYKVVGPTYIHGLNDAQGLLGELPKPWSITIERPGDIWRFRNDETNAVSNMDPRLPSLPAGWSMTADGKFLHKESGKISVGDPRCDEENLKKMGVDLKEFLLV